MSGPLQTPIASAASRIAAMAECRNRIAAWPKKQGQSQTSRTWAGMSERIRHLLVMIAATQAGEPQRIARQPWESFSEADRVAIVAARKNLLDELSAAAGLF